MILNHNALQITTYSNAKNKCSVRTMVQTPTQLVSGSAESQRLLLALNIKFVCTLNILVTRTGLLGHAHMHTHSHTHTQILGLVKCRGSQ